MRDMPNGTKRGRTLARSLERYWFGISTTEWLRAVKVCSSIARHAATHCRLQEAACSVEMTERQQARHDLRDTLTETRITLLVSTLPPVDGQPLTVRFEGDPRGYTVKIQLPLPKHTQAGNTWGLNGQIGV